MEPRGRLALGGSSHRSVSLSLWHLASAGRWSGKSFDLDRIKGERPVVSASTGGPFSCPAVDLGARALGQRHLQRSFRTASPGSDEGIRWQPVIPPAWDARREPTAEILSQRARFNGLLLVGTPPLFLESAAPHGVGLLRSWSFPWLDDGRCPHGAGSTLAF